MIIGLVMKQQDRVFTPVATISLSSGKSARDSAEYFKGYVYGVLETLFHHHPLFSGNPQLCWEEYEGQALPSDLLDIILY